MNLRSDYHDTSGVILLTLTDLILARNHIKVQPGTIGTLHHPFGAEDIVRIDKLLKYFLKFCTLEFVRCLLAPAGKYIICMMMVMVLMVMAATGTVFTWIYFDMVSGEYELREGEPDYTGRLCVIGTDLKEDKLEELFELV